MSYETIVGLEVHVQLSTRTKLFCSCPVEFGAPPNTNVCPVCLGLPGVLPVVNREAFERGVRVALALGCEVPARTKFDRKSYYYPDLPKNYQISQYDEPVGERGELRFMSGGKLQTVRIRRVHLEEDAGKLVHAPGGGASLVDLNRTGTPLVEIVTEPDIRSGAEARAYLEELRRVLRYIGVSECNMEEGSMRCEPNISVRSSGSDKLGVKTEVKNLNSFAAVEGAVEYEARRQSQCIESGERVRQVTMLWDAERSRTREMRSKEEAHDYRYFPEPDLAPMDIAGEWLDGLRAATGELPQARRERYASAHGLSEYDINVLVAEKDVADYFERVVGAGADAKAAANWVTQDMLRVVGERRCAINECGVTPEALAGLIAMIGERRIDNTIARDKVFPLMVATARAAAEVVEAEGLAMVSDESELEAIAREVIEENPKPLADIAKNPRAAGRYIGLVRQASGGRADVQVVKQVVARVIMEKTGVEVAL